MNQEQEVLLPPRPSHQCPPLSEAQIEAIAERAAEVALEKVYRDIGKSFLHRVLWLVGAAALAIIAYFKGKGVA